MILATDFKSKVLRQTYKEQYPLNKISTSKYTIYTFIPKNLFVQIILKLPNLYFTVLLILEMLPIIGTGVPSLLMPITFVVSLSMIKDGFEDYQRKKSDDEENNRTAECITIQK